jgi:uncharacterized protein (TIGR02466 family)
MTLDLKINEQQNRRITVDLGLANKIDLFSTPIHVFKIENFQSLNTALKSQIMDRAAVPGLNGTSNIGGWHSDVDLESWSQESKLLCELIMKSAQNVVKQDHKYARVGGASLQAWANVTIRNGFNMPHLHHMSSMSGVYYVCIGNSGQEAGGELVFFDPRCLGQAHDNLGFPGVNTIDHKVNPQDGMLIIFPSWLKHWVTPYHSDEPRVSIAFNIRLNSNEQL